MSANWNNRMMMFAGAVLMTAVLFILARSLPAQAQRTEARSTGPHYTVIETQGFNLLVTDNAANKLYYYATDKDAPVGSALKLRASLDLSQIGEKEISLQTHNLENMRKKEGR
jgi:hypothetical protein